MKVNKFYMMVGLPASGKSYYSEIIANNNNGKIFSSDKLREELFDNICDCEHNNEVFVELYKRIKRSLNNGDNVIMDATNINHKRRKAFLDEIKKINCEKICIFVATPYERCLELNENRDRKVPEYVIKKMYKNIIIPQYDEGWDEIKIFFNTGDMKFSMYQLFNGNFGLNKILQENSHHTLSIGEHCCKCSELVANLNGDGLLITAGLFHDIGKAFTKDFKNSKGEATIEAHYFNHMQVSAYDSLFYLNQNYTNNNKDILKIVNYIQWHMQPFFLTTEKSKQKFTNFYGQEFYNNLLILHEADKGAR